MCNIKISDFKVGQKVFVELDGNASRGKKRNELIEEWVVISVGRKFVTAKPIDRGREIKFKQHDVSYGGLIEVTDYCVDFILYPNEEFVKDKLEKEDLVSWFKTAFSGFNNNSKYSLEKLREAKNILMS